MLARAFSISRHLSTQACTTTANLRRAMTTFTLPDSDPQCRVHLIDDLSKEQLLDFPAFKNWIGTLQHSLRQQKNKSHTFHDAPYKLRSIQIQHVDRFGGGRIGFIKFMAEVTNDDGEKLPGSVFLRGGSVAMLVRKTCHRLCAT